MSWIPVAPLRFCWWNTGLSPPVPKASYSREEFEFCVDQVRILRGTYEFALLGLCEVSEADVTKILLALGDSSLSAVCSPSADGKLIFDTAIVYDRNQIVPGENRNFVELFGRARFKLGELRTFTTIANGTDLHVVVSHWPSQRSLSEFEPGRANLGMLLRQSLMKWRTGTSPYIVLMGDYNDDPFSPSLSGHLLATRDRELAKRNPEFFYNPFWRCLGESLPFPQIGLDESICGSHFYRSGHDSQWFTYDQMIFSSAFLGEGTMVLEEEHTSIVTSSELRGRLRDRDHACDHLPVTTRVMLRKTQ
jgi:hypothetical protein